LPKHAQAQLTKEAVTQAIDEALAKAGDKAPKAVDIAKLAGEAVTGVIGNLRREKKVVFGDAAPGHELIEVPVSWTKGNLPLHGKQLLNVLMKRPMNDGIQDSDLQQGFRLGEGVIHRLRTGYQSLGAKALTSVTQYGGLEFVPTDLSSELQRRMFMASDLYALLSANEIDMSSENYTWPLTTTRPSFYLNTTQNTATTASTPGTGSVVIASKKAMCEVTFSYECDEDSIIPILPWLQGEIAAAAAETMENVLLNGDTTGTHMDSDTELVATHYNRAWKGFRKLALAVTELKKNLTSGGISAANLRVLKKAMAKYGRNPRDLILVTGVSGENDLLGLTEVITMDKLGANATILTGRLPQIYGIPIVTSAYCREDLNASGVYDNSTKTMGSIILVNRTQFILGRRREFTVETEKVIQTQTTRVVASFRKGFTPIETPSATVPSVVVGYNYTA
jgi:HK97 family phage major capsid protein